MLLYRAEVSPATSPEVREHLGSLTSVTEAFGLCQAHSPVRLRWQMPTYGLFVASSDLTEYRIIQQGKRPHEALLGTKPVLAVREPPVDWQSALKLQPQGPLLEVQTFHTAEEL